MSEGGSVGRRQNRGCLQVSAQSALWIRSAEQMTREYTDSSPHYETNTPWTDGRRKIPMVQREQIGNLKRAVEGAGGTPERLKPDNSASSFLKRELNQHRGRSSGEHHFGLYFVILCDIVFEFSHDHALSPLLESLKTCAHLEDQNFQFVSSSLQLEFHPVVLFQHQSSISKGLGEQSTLPRNQKQV